MKTPRWFSPNRFFSILRIASGGALLSAGVAIGLMAMLTGPSIATADDTNAVHYYVSLGNSLAASFQPNGDDTHGYAEQLYASLVAVDIGANDLFRLDAQGNEVTCLFEPAGCATQTARMVENLSAIPAAARAAAGPHVPIVAMSYYDVFAPLCASDPSLLFVCSRIDAFNATLVDTYAAAGDPVSDVAGAFENENLVNCAAHVCDWTWFCALGDIHPNTVGYGVIAEAFEQVLP